MHGIFVREQADLAHGGPDGAAMRLLEAKYPGIPMVVITGHDDVEPPLAPREVLRKPFRTEALLAVLERLHASASA